MSRNTPQLPAGWPAPPQDPTAALQHTLDLYADQPGDAMVIVATSNVYGPGVKTGLTWGDLRALAARFDPR